jgi:hypothetical protein
MSVHGGSYLFGDSVMQESVAKHCYRGGSGRLPRGCCCSGIRTGNSRFAQEQTAWLLRLWLHLGLLDLAASPWATRRSYAKTSSSRRCWCCSSCTGSSRVQALHPLMRWRAGQYHFRNFTSCMCLFTIDVTTFFIVNKLNVLGRSWEKNKYAQIFQRIWLCKK